MFETWLFYAFAAVLVVSALLVITARNPVHGVLFLVLAFFTAAGIWLLLRAEFLAIALVVVYVGAVMVLFLVLAFFTAAGIWLLLRAEFLAIALVVVYVGAVMVLFLFVVMMLDINLERVREGFWRNLPLALVVGGIMMIEMVLILANKIFGTAPAQVPAGYSNTKQLGRVLYTQYAYAFEIAAVVLLVAIIAAIALTLRKRKDSRYQAVAEQVKVRRAERVRLVSMKPETDK